MFLFVSPLVLLSVSPLVLPPKQRVFGWEEISDLCFSMHVGCCCGGWFIAKVDFTQVLNDMVAMGQTMGA